MTSPCHSNAASQCSSGSNPLWDVQDILAERTSITGENELLVVWKPSWIPVSNVDANGPVMDRFQAATQLKFSHPSSNMRIYIPVDPDTTLAVDYEVLKERVKPSERGRITSHFTAAATLPTGPSRMHDGQTTKRALSPSHPENSKTFKQSHTADESLSHEN